MSTAEAEAAFLGTVAADGHSSEPHAYYDECGWDGYVWGGVSRIYLRFSDSRVRLFLSLSLSLVTTDCRQLTHITLLPTHALDY